MKEEIITEFEAAKKNYIVVKVVCDNLRKELDDLNAPINQAECDGKITVDEWAEQVTNNEFSLGYPQARDVLIQSENALLTIAKKILLVKAPDERKPMLETVFAEGPKFLHIREQILELMLRYDPTK